MLTTTPNGKLRRVLQAITDATGTPPRYANTGWLCRCPAHEDTDPSLSVREGDDGRVLLNCFAYCEPEDVLKAAGLEWSDLFPEESTPNGKPRIVATYDYCDEDGNLLFQACRREPGANGRKKDFQMRRPTSDGWDYSVKGVRRVPYRLAELIQHPDGVVWVVEGEADADRLRAHGMLATCNAGGAGKWYPEHSECLKGRTVVIVPDEDEAGLRHAQNVAESLHAAGCTVKLLRLPEGPHPTGYDVSDWLDAGGDVEELDRLADAADEWKPPDDATEETVDDLLSLLDPKTRTDAGNGRRIALNHGDRIRWCSPWKKWICWDGRQWLLDHECHVEALAKKTMDGLWHEVASLSDTMSAESARAAFTFCRRSNNTSGVEAALKMARSEEGVPISHDELDRDPWLLNVQNGTLDLRTGALRPHTPSDLITYLAPVQFDPGATCPIWTGFLSDIFASDHELIDYVQRLVGLALTGQTTEHLLPIFWGSGANGKSTLIQAVLGLLGDYGMKAPRDLLVTKRHERHPTELADLYRKRLVACVETQAGQRFDESLVKELTGGDTIRARRMREDHWQFVPTHKVWLATNHKPRVYGTDHAIWRRLRLVPFTVQIPPAKQDKRLGDKLADERSGILNWAITGCLRWQSDGLPEPVAVTAATDDYRRDMDSLQQFLDERCTQDPSAVVSAETLRREYTAWAGLKQAITRNAFAGEMQARGYESTRWANGSLRNKKVYIGLQLNDE